MVYNVIDIMTGEVVGQVVSDHDARAKQAARETYGRCVRVEQIRKPLPGEKEWEALKSWEARNSAAIRFADAVNNDGADFFSAFAAPSEPMVADIEECPLTNEELEAARGYARFLGLIR